VLHYERLGEWRLRFVAVYGSSLAAHNELSGSTGQLVGGGNVQHAIANVGDVDDVVVRLQIARNQVAIWPHDLGRCCSCQSTDHLTRRRLVALLPQWLFLYSPLVFQSGL